MKSMPSALKEKLRQYERAIQKSRVIHEKITEELNKYGVPYENLVATSDAYNDEPFTEALAFISYGEGDIEQNIEEIENVFLYFANQKDDNF